MKKYKYLWDKIGTMLFIFIALSLSVAFQLVAAVLAVSLIKKTRYNIAWILLSIGFACIAMQRIYDLYYLSQLNGKFLPDVSFFSNWFSVLISFVIFVGTIYIKKLFNYMEKMEMLVKENESKIFSAIVQTEERERQMFAKELHDGLGPILSSIKMAFSAINKDRSSEIDKQIMLKTNFAIDEAVITVKEISNKLSPHILSNFGLERAIKSFLDTVMIKQPVVVDYSSKLHQPRFDFTVETVMYRVVCELITNTLKHANAQHISIALESIENELSLVYTDDGQGFDTEGLTYRGMGLSNMESRVKSINGIIQITSAVNKGVKVSIRVPI